MANRQVVICAPVRTAIGTYGGTLKDSGSRPWCCGHPCLARSCEIATGRD
jgi:hypothetical protein